MDIKQQFTEAVKTGCEIEFSYCRQHYFASRHSSTDWYVYHEEEKQEQHFSTVDDLIENAILQGTNINDIWAQISIDCIL